MKRFDIMEEQIKELERAFVKEIVDILECSEKKRINFLDKLCKKLNKKSEKIIYIFSRKISRTKKVNMDDYSTQIINLVEEAKKIFEKFNADTGLTLTTEKYGLGATPSSETEI